MNGHVWSADLLKTLAHPVRLQILQELQDEGQACVCHLVHALGQRQAYISQQLTKLRQAGLVVDQQQGMYVYYSLADDAILPLLESIRKTAVKLAGARGEQLSFPRVNQQGSSPCTCPRCMQEVASVDLEKAAS